MNCQPIINSSYSLLAPSIHTGELTQVVASAPGMKEQPLRAALEVETTEYPR